jgi:hypothetical protein
MPTAVAGRLIVLIVTLLAAVSLSAQSQTCLGDVCWAGGDIVGIDSEAVGRPWNLVSNSQSMVNLKGVLLEWHVNKGDPVWHDWDLCIFVKPAPGYERYSVNALNFTNPTNEGHAAGNIEMEVKALAEGLHDKPKDNFQSFFGDLFQLNEEIEAYGWWVQDWGHDPDNPKTELHPLIYLKQRNGSQTSLFAASDGSGRFFVVPEDQEFTFSLPRRTVKAKGTHSEWDESGVLITEQSSMDISTGTRSRLVRGE